MHKQDLQFKKGTLVKQAEPDEAARTRKELMEVQKANAAIEQQISQLLKSNEAKKIQYRQLRENLKCVQAEMQKITDEHLKMLEDRFKEQTGGVGLHGGLSPFQIMKLVSFKYEAGPDINVCLICYCDLQHQARVKKLPGCQHLFHSNCIKEHLTVSKMCPACGEEVVIPS